MNQIELENKIYSISKKLELLKDSFNSYECPVMSVVFELMSERSFLLDNEINFIDDKEFCKLLSDIDSTLNMYQKLHCKYEKISSK